LIFDKSDKRNFLEESFNSSQVNSQRLTKVIEEIFSKEKLNSLQVSLPAEGFFDPLSKEDLS